MWQFWHLKRPKLSMQPDRDSFSASHDCQLLWMRLSTSCSQAEHSMGVAGRQLNAVLPVRLLSSRACSSESSVQPPHSFSKVFDTVLKLVPALLGLQAKAVWKFGANHRSEPVSFHREKQKEGNCVPTCQRNRHEYRRKGPHSVTWIFLRGFHGVKIDRPVQGRADSPQISAVGVNDAF